MADISAAAVKALRDRTGLPMMECKQALQQASGDTDAAERWLREQGKKTMEMRSGRETASGRIAIFLDPAKPAAAMIELLCESAPVAGHEEFQQLAADLAKQLATGPGAKTAEELLKQPSPSKPGKTLQDQVDDLGNRIREVFRVNRLVRIDATCGGYAHHNGATGVLVEIAGGTAELAKEVSMHVAAMKPQAVTKEELDPAVVTREREIQTEVARKEGKPESIIAKMIEGRLRNFYAEKVLMEQPFVKDEKQTVGQIAKAGNMRVLRFVRWELGKE